MRNTSGKTKRSQATARSDSLIRLRLTKLEEALAVKELNEELLDANHNLLTRLIRMKEKSGERLDDNTLELVGRVRRILAEMQNPPPQRKHSDRTPQQSTVYISVHK